MKRETISLALNRLDDRHISDTTDFLPGVIQNSEERILHMKKKRSITFALAAVLMLALAAVAYAVSGTPRWTATHAMKDTGEYTSLEDLEKIESLIGYDICLVDQFSCGYRFSKLLVAGEAVYDENNTALEEYYSVYSTYHDPDGTELTLALSPVLELPGSQEAPAPSSEHRIGDTVIRISHDRYKLVPPDYEETEEDLANEAAGHFYISYGADEIEEKDYISSEFVLNGVNYCFLTDDGSKCTDEMLIRMATEIIDAANA